MGKKKKLYSFTKSSSYIYIYIFTWTILLFLWVGIAFFSFWLNIYLQWNRTNQTLSPETCKVFLVFNFIFTWLLYSSTIKDFIYCLLYNLILKNRIKKENFLCKWDKNNSILKSNPKVFILYTTCDDFDEFSLLKSMKQTYKNCMFFILDDSKEYSYKKRIDEFSKTYNIELVRRKDRKGFKAGNINNFLKNRSDYDYFVLLDADEVIPRNFVKSVLPYFSKDEIGIVQCNNKCDRQDNMFDYLGSFIHNTQWNTEYNVRDRVGIVNCCGHGAIISRKAFEAIDGFPELILEDWAFTLKALKFGYSTVYANEIICWEEFPTNYLAFKKRNFRWTQGGVQCFLKFGFKLPFTKNVPFFRKVDIWLSQSSFIITIFSLITIMTNIWIMIPLGFNFEYPNWYTFISIFFAAVPIINCFIYNFKKVNFGKLILILILFYILYASLFVSVIIAIFETMFGKKLNFIVTPKKEFNKFTFWDAIKYNKIEIIVGIILTIALILLLIFLPKTSLFNFVWLILLIIPMFLSIPLTLLSNIKLKNKIHEMENKIV